MTDVRPTDLRMEHQISTFAEIKYV